MERKLHTPQVGIAEATGSHAVWADTEDANMHAMVAMMVEVFMVSGFCDCLLEWLRC